MSLLFARSVAGAGRAFRSIFPFDVMGNPPGFTPTTALGIMYAGRLERSATRKTRAFAAGTIENTEFSAASSSSVLTGASGFSDSAAPFLLTRSVSAFSALAVALAPLLVSSRSISAVSSQSPPTVR